MTISRTSVSLDDALMLTRAAMSEAERRGIGIAVVVLDSSGRTVVAADGDTAPLMAMSMAQGKAGTAVGMGQSTAFWEQVAQDNLSFGGSITSVAGFTPFGGGVPLRVRDELVGAIGVSGGTVEQDVAIAEAAATVFTTL